MGKPCDILEHGEMEKYLQMFSVVTVMMMLSTTPVSSTCCTQRTVSGVGDQLDGIYTYKEDRLDGNLEEPCEGGCVYTKVGVLEDEYCFRQAMLGQGMVVECEESSERVLDLASTPLLIGKASLGMFKIFSMN